MTTSNENDEDLRCGTLTITDSNEPSFSISTFDSDDSSMHDSIEIKVKKDKNPITQELKDDVGIVDQATSPSVVSDDSSMHNSIEMKVEKKKRLITQVLKDDVRIADQATTIVDGSVAKNCQGPNESRKINTDDNPRSISPVHKVKESSPGHSNISNHHASFGGNTGSSLVLKVDEAIHRRISTNNCDVLSDKYISRETNGDRNAQRRENIVDTLLQGSNENSQINVEMIDSQLFQFDIKSHRETIGTTEYEKLSELIDNSEPSYKEEHGKPHNDDERIENVSVNSESSQDEKLDMTENESTAGGNKENMTQLFHTTKQTTESPQFGILVVPLEAQFRLVSNMQRCAEDYIKRTIPGIKDPQRVSSAKKKTCSPTLIHRAVLLEDNRPALEHTLSEAPKSSISSHVRVSQVNEENSLLKINLKPVSADINLYSMGHNEKAPDIDDGKILLQPPKDEYIAHSYEKKSDYLELEFPKFFSPKKIESIKEGEDYLRNWEHLSESYRRHCDIAVAKKIFL
jgi:hypothetical protein